MLLVFLFKFCLTYSIGRRWVINVTPCIILKGRCRHNVLNIQVDCVITSYELLPKFHSMLNLCPRVRTLIVMEDQLYNVDTTGISTLWANRSLNIRLILWVICVLLRKYIEILSGFKEGVKIVLFEDVVSLGSDSQVIDAPPGPQDTAIIMYTSGSTGTPKVSVFCRAGAPEPVEPPFFEENRSRIDKNGWLRPLINISKKVYFLGKRQLKNWFCFASKKMKWYHEK